MPTVAVDKERLFSALGNPDMQLSHFEELCFNFGVELDDVTSQREMASRELSSSTAAQLEAYSDRTILKIDVSANRYDLLCAEGLARSLRIFLGLEMPPVFKASFPADHLKITVKAATAAIRPFIVGAVLRNVALDQFAYESFIELQEKLHSGLCRRRTKVAIGTHDLDKVAPGILTYNALAPSEISFVPLNQNQKMTGIELMQFYEADRRLSKFLHIIRDSPVYPVVMDSKSTVLSLPPIINGDATKISVNTKNIFIECTATEEPKAKQVLCMLVAMFSQYCKTPFSFEQVEVVYEADGRKVVTPEMSPRKMLASKAYINSCISRSVVLTAPQMTGFLSKMGLAATVMADGDTLEVEVPVTRTDVLHACDIMEDVAVAYGINTIPKSLPATNTVGGAFPLNKLSDWIRREVAYAGWSECSHEENYSFLRKVDPGNEAVTLANPTTLEYELVRTSLIPGLLKTILSNKKSPLPLKLFEVGDVVLQDPTADRLSRNERRFCAVFCNKNSGLELIHGLLDRVMDMLAIQSGLGAKNVEGKYVVKDSDLPTFFPGRQAQIYYGSVLIGQMGILHPEVLEKYEIPYPVSLVEFNLEQFL